MSRPWYELLFENSAKKYDTQDFTLGTIGECDFIEQELNFDKSLKILDIGCGTGRHTIELVKRGYSVVGVDLSEAQLARAREKSGAQGLQIDFQRCNARNLPFESAFDAAVMLCEGGFPLMETDEMNYEILRSTTIALKPRSKLILTSLNALYPLAGIPLSGSGFNEHPNGTGRTEQYFDTMSLRHYSELKHEDDDGTIKTITCNERYYMPTEINWLLRTLGYTRIDIMAAKLGKFSRQDVLTWKDCEMLVVAERSPA